LVRETAVADRVDATVQPVQAPGFHFALDGGTREVELALQLANRDHAVLPLSQDG
jgi:hypothetical protein